MSILIAGSIALDDLETPFGKRKNVLGGSAVHASVAASFFSPVKMLGVVGEDFPQEHKDLLTSRNIDIEGVRTVKGKTFHWEGFYEYDMNQAHTVKTDLNALAKFDPSLPERYKTVKYVFLANLDPDLQLKIISQLKSPKLIVADTMNYWIESKRDSLIEVIKKVDVMLMNDAEARELMKVPNLITAARRILELGVKYVIIKKGEHGALLFSNKIHFSAPSYPQENLIDPTGAGDSFAGGFIGYLARNKKINDHVIKTAVIIGSVIASYNVEDFSLDKMRKLKKKDIVKRYAKFKRHAEFDELSINSF